MREFASETKDVGEVAEKTPFLENMLADMLEKAHLTPSDYDEADVSLDDELAEDLLEDGVYEETGESRTLIPRTGGVWDGEAGNSTWHPDLNEVPADKHGTNPEGKSWEEILNKYGIDGIPFKEGEPDFSEISKGTVEIDDFSEDRDSNFAQADEKLAEKKGGTPEEVREWRKENGYTWHECKDCKTMQEVPTEVHGNVPHSGGISEIKKEQ